jgi:hypothetical protein
MILICPTSRNAAAPWPAGSGGDRFNLYSCRLRNDISPDAMNTALGHKDQHKPGGIVTLTHHEIDPMPK